MNSCVKGKQEGNPSVDVVLLSIGWGENGRAALIPLSSSTSRSALVYPHFAWHACRITCWNLVNSRREPRYYVRRTFLAEKRTWIVTVWHKLWLLCGSLKVAVRNTFIKNSAFSENLNHSFIFFSYSLVLFLRIQMNDVKLVKLIKLRSIQNKLFVWTRPPLEQKPAPNRLAASHTFSLRYFPFPLENNIW